MKFDVPVGATPIDDVSGLIVPNIFSYSQLCDVEARNILKAREKYFIFDNRNPVRWFDPLEYHNLIQILLIPKTSDLA